jgi:hypothetical protein
LADLLLKYPVAREKVFKQTVKIDQTRVTNFLPPDHPVLKGVMEARRILGGRFPEHVREIRILPDTKLGSQKGTIIAGQCVQRPTGGSLVRIFAGSIEEAVPSFLVDIRATNTTLHEFGHSDRAREMQEGSWIGHDFNSPWEERDAEDFVEQAHRQYQERTSKGRPHRTWGDLLRERKAQNGE